MIEYQSRLVQGRGRHVYLLSGRPVASAQEAQAAQASVVESRFSYNPGDDAWDVTTDWLAA